jgi:autotransporter translocation and assembly factor TamB
MRIQGDEVYYRSTDGSVEAIADLDLRFTGQDTLSATGEVPVLQAGYFGNFTSGTSFEESVVRATGRGMFTYNLNTILPGNLIIENDLLQAEFEGELFLIDYGDGELRFSGTLSALPNGKFFYLGNELRIISGQLVFNPVEFNPQISFIASIDIDGEEVELSLTGDLLEPQLILPQDPNLNQSDILAYLTINQKVVEEGFDATQLVDPVESYVGILVEKQLERYGKQIIGLDIVDLRMEGSGTVFDGFSNPDVATRLLLGQRVSNNLKVTYEGDIRSTEPGTAYDFGLEYQVNRNFSITSKVDQDGLFQLRGRLKYSY